jgi:ribonucleoside-triphosphate reductase
VFETWAQTVYRVIGHQRWLWERAKGSALDANQELELAELEKLMLDRKVSVSGRTLWLGGTEVAKAREASQFNCSFSAGATVHDLVDHFWLLLQGCGVGTVARPGVLNGLAKPVKEIEVIRSTRTIDQWNAGERGEEANSERFYQEADYRVWHLTVGDSAAAWAKALGKLMAMKKPVDKIVLDFSQVRAGGIRLRGYGWISSGDETIAVAFKAITELLSRRAGQLLTRIDLLDVENWMGTTLSSRRSAEIVLCPYGDPEWEQFALAKDKWWEKNPQRAQSNNSLVFESRPSKAELFGIFYLMQQAGGSEPGFVNGQAARKRGPWFAGFNPCVEIILGDKSFCNLVEVDLGKFNEDLAGLCRAIYIASRANYRQTCVNLKDGILQESWHELNEFLRLQGVGLTGIVKWELCGEPTAFQILKEWAHRGSYEMADELGLPRSKAITTVKPSGTLSKIMDTTEGVHKPLGKYIFNRVGFSKHDPIVDACRSAGYLVEQHPTDTSSVLICFPVAYEDVAFTSTTIERDGKSVQVEVNVESAIDQLQRYKLLMDNYVDHNCSNTISYSPDEVPAIVDWIYENWDSYVGVSFLYRNDPTKTAQDLGYLYLPQTVVTREDYEAYVAQLKPVDLDGTNSFDELQDEGCATGACPIR